MTFPPAPANTSDAYASVQPQLRQLPERRILYVTAHTVDHASFPDACRHAIGTLFAHIGANSIEYIPGTFAGLCPFTESDVDLPLYYQASVNLAEATVAATTAEVQLGAISGGRELVGIHTGPYSTLTQSWDLLNDYRKQLGEEVRGGIIYDVYVDDPATVDEGAMRTELHIPLW